MDFQLLPDMGRMNGQQHSVARTTCCRLRRRRRSLGDVCSLIATAKLNNVEPFAYLKDVLERMSNGHSMSRLDELLP